MVDLGFFFYHKMNTKHSFYSVHNLKKKSTKEANETHPSHILPAVVVKYNLLRNNSQ